MAIKRFLAMTGAEISNCPQLPEKTAWMACHFSLYSQGLSNLPEALPAGSLLVLDDASPFFDHDTGRISGELSRCADTLGCCGVLLDFQRPKVPEVHSLVQRLCEALPCPVAVAAAYARGCSGPVFLPPLPCHVPLRDWLTPWAGREAWLELALDGESIILTEKGAEIVPGGPGESGFEDKKLHCHYTVAVEEQEAVFKLWRSRSDLEGLLEEADRLGVKAAVGLYQELA